MDRTITATEANQRFSELLREVSAGTTFTITSRGRPVAEIAPVTRKQRPDGQELEDLWAELDRLPRLVPGQWSRDELYER